MANIRTHPNEWEEILDALEAGDINKASKLVVKYKFNHDIRENASIVEPKRYKKRVYFCQSPVGELKRFEKSRGMAEYLDISISTIHNRINEGQSVWKRGPLKGWTIWREKA